jgi:hypothetical protein
VSDCGCQELSAAIGQQELEDGTDFDMGSILDAMVDDFKCRWGDGSNLLEFKYGQSGTGVGQPCGYTREQFLQFAADPRMVTLPFVCAEIEEDIWQLLQTALTEMIVVESEPFINFLLHNHFITEIFFKKKIRRCK